MRWPWTHQQDDRADRALAASREQLEAAHRQSDTVRHIADRLRELRETNNFADSVRRALGEGS